MDGTPMCVAPISRGVWVIGDSGGSLWHAVLLGAVGEWRMNRLQLDPPTQARPHHGISPTLPFTHFTNPKGQSTPKVRPPTLNTISPLVCSWT
jgi:hypothetical protein